MIGSGINVKDILQRLKAKVVACQERKAKRKEGRRMRYEETEMGVYLYFEGQD